MEYSVKNIEKILIAASLNENTRNKYHYLENIEDIRKALSLPEYSQAVEAYKNGHRIYRGHKQQEDYLGMIVTPGIRKSQDNANVYTKLMSEILPSWSAYPRRDRAVICTNDFDYAKGFSKKYPFLVFPQNNTKIGVCPRYDIWDSFPRIQEKNCHTIKSFGNFLIEFISIVLNLDVKEVENIFLQDSVTVSKIFRTVNTQCKKIKQKIKNNVIPNPFENKHEIIQYLFNNIGVYYLTDLLDEYLMNPYENNFRLVDIDNIPYGSNELWFEGQHLMVRFDIGYKLLNKA